MDETNLPRGESRFRLPPDVSFRKHCSDHGWAYVFRHRTLGELGCILLQDRADGRCQISCEVVGDPADPMTAQRAAIFTPLGLELSERLQAATGPLTGADWAPPPPRRPPEPVEVIESKLIPCERRGTMVAMLIFADGATDPGRFEDYARKMYPEYTRLDLPTWIVGPALGSGPPGDRPADIVQVWPARALVQRLRPAEFNPLFDRLATEHCGSGRSRPSPPTASAK